MKIEEVKAACRDAINIVYKNRAEYVMNPDKDFVRNRKLQLPTLLHCPITQESKSTKNKLIEFSINSDDPPCEAAPARQRAKLKPESVQVVFREVTDRIKKLRKQDSTSF